MQTTEPTALLEAAVDQHSRRCALAKSAIDGQRWPAAACSLRMAATLAEDWANRARDLAEWCDVQATGGRTFLAANASPDSDAGAMDLELQGMPTLEALEAGLMVLAHSMGREQAMRVRRAMNGVLTAAFQPAALPAEAALIGASLDQASLEQAD